MDEPNYCDIKWLNAGFKRHPDGSRRIIILMAQSAADVSTDPPAMIRRWRSSAAIYLAVAYAAAATFLAYVGYSAISEWQHSAELLASRRAESAADLLLTAIMRDMRAVQSSVLVGPARDDFLMNRPDILSGVASAFARYPYPEVFFGWRGTPTPESVVFYSRVDRPPQWMAADAGAARSFPVVSSTEPAAARELIERINADAMQERGYSLFDAKLGSERCQVIASIIYSNDQPAGAFGFIVNLDWIHDHYFRELTEQVSRVASAGSDVTLLVSDERGAFVGRAGTTDTGRLTARRTFPLLFFDPTLIAVGQPHDLSGAQWSVQALIVDDPTVVAANRGAQRTLILALVTAVMLAIGLALTVQSSRRNARLAEMRAEFVSTVTHTLKTPIAGIRAVCETMTSHRATPELSREYAHLAVHEAKRLGRLVDNLLAYSRVTDITEVYSFEPVSLGEVVDTSLSEFSSQLMVGGFQVHQEVGPDVPVVRADRTALLLLLDNLIENAIRYSADRREITIRVQASGDMVELEVSDKGIGIPAEEIESVTGKFLRGRSTGTAGTGLGLAIATRIANDHNGKLTIRSTVGVGTTVTVTLPFAAAA